LRFVLVNVGRRPEVTGGGGNALTALLPFELYFWVGKKERLASLTMLSWRAVKQSSLCVVDIEATLKGHSSRAATLAVERWRRRDHDLLLRTDAVAAC
jgi:hypothetical protein